MAVAEEAKVENFLRWLQVNGAELRGCGIKYCDSSKGFGLFYSGTSSSSEGVLMVVPLDLAITPMRVLLDPLMGPRCNELYNNGEEDDRFLMILFLTVERLRANSPWKPYIDMLPTSFGSPLWFSEDELAELRGTPLYRATLLQRKSLQAVFDDKVKNLVKNILVEDDVLEGGKEVIFEDFLWANSIFWTRALNIPFPRSYVFPSPSVEADASSLNQQNYVEDNLTQICEIFGRVTDSKSEACCTNGKDDPQTTEMQSEETVWVEGLVPGIDFCNHGLGATTTWEVDRSGDVTGVPSTMYLVSGLKAQHNSEAEQEIQINYGNKGNEELLYLYGFVIDNNPDDFLMMHYPLDAFKNDPLADAKDQLLHAQNAELRWLLSRNLLDRGFFSNKKTDNKTITKDPLTSLDHSYSWSGQRKAPSYMNKLVFPDELLTSLRTIAMSEQELMQVSSLLEELVGSCGKRRPSDKEVQAAVWELVGSCGKRRPSNKEVQAAVWEVCGDSGALQILVDLLLAKTMELEEGSGTEASDSELLRSCNAMDNSEYASTSDDLILKEKVNGNKWSSIIYRRGQKQLARQFLKEAEHLLDLCLQDKI